MAKGAATAIGNPAAAGTDTVLVAAKTGKRINVLAVASVAGGTATDLTFNTKGAGVGVAISPLFSNNAHDGVILPYNEKGWFTTGVGEGLTTTTGAGSATGIVVTYEVVS